jgi:hypothetical protein
MVDRETKRENEPKKVSEIRKKKRDIRNINGIRLWLHGKIGHIMHHFSVVITLYARASSGAVRSWRC